jgi:hypothetical protein
MKGKRKETLLKLFRPGQVSEAVQATLDSAPLMMMKNCNSGRVLIDLCADGWKTVQLCQFV